MVLSFAISAIVSLFAALCYAELAAMIPVAGSAYTYAYATMGELIAWIIGWDLILEYLVGAAAVAVGWSGYFVSFLQDFGVNVSPAWTNAPFIFDSATESFEMTGAYFNIPAFAISIFCTVLLYVGIRETAVFNNLSVVIKILVIFIFLGAAAPHVNRENWKPFVPPNTGTFGEFGWSGVLQGATTVFFSYIGFDAVTTTSQECKNPQRDLPIGIIGSLVICAVLYIAVSLVLTGVVPYTLLDVPHPIAIGIDAVGVKWLSPVVEIGALAGLSSVLLVSLMGQPRIFYSMAHDGLLPMTFAKIHPRFGTPHVTTAVSGLFCAVLAALLPVDVLADLTSIGTLFAFVIVCLGVMVLRIQKPNLHRPFKVPFGPYVVPVLGALFNLSLIVTARPSTIYRLFIWLGLGVCIYLLYGYKHSVVNREPRLRSSSIENDLFERETSFQLPKDVAAKVEDERRTQRVPSEDIIKLI